MKKIILAFISIFTMLICIAQPLFVHAEGETLPETTHLEDLEHTDGDIPSRPVGKLHGYEFFRNGEQTDTYFIYVVIKQKYDNIFMFHETYLSFENGSASFDDGVLEISNASSSYNVNTHGRYSREMWSSNTVFYNDNYDGNHSFTNASFDFTNMSFLVQDNNGAVTRCNLSTSGNDNVRGTYNIYSNIPELLNTNSLNVYVDFSPDLIGNVDRQITATDGTKSMRKDLAMEVVNQSNFPIQYDMRIYKVNQSSSRDWSLNPETFATQFDSDSVSYDDDPVFIYYKNEWVYTTNYDSESTFWDLEPVKENKGASWHYLASKSQDIVLFNFTQINLDENVDYYVEVRAVRNDYGCSSEKIVYLASDNPAESEYKQIQGDDIVTVYHEQFKMINYSDVVYNPNEESNGVLPYNGKNGIVSRNTYQYGRNARDNGNGNIDYTARNLYTDQNSWYNQQYNRVVSNHTSNASSGSVPSNITNLFDSFMKFVSYVFLRFPANLQTIYVYGFVSVVVLGIVLKVIK